MFTMKCKTTGWCAVAFTTGDGKSMKDYDIALGGWASGNGYLGVSGMDFIQYKELSSFNLEHLALTPEGPVYWIAFPNLH